MKSSTPSVSLVDPQRAEALKQASLGIKSITLSKRQMCDLELLLNGGFAPLDRFMDQATYDAVVERMELPDGTLWPMPIEIGRAHV